MNTQEVQQFVETNKFPIVFTNLQDRCVDGRPTDAERAAVEEHIENLPAISKPGATIGDLIITLGALNKLEIQADPQIVLDSILKTYGGAANIKFHTDVHAEGKGAGPGRGCGHINFATQHPEEYHLTTDQTDFILNKLPVLLEDGAKQVVLDGPHDEKAVLVIESDFYGVKPYLGDKQCFIYQKRLHEHQLDKLAKPLAKDLADSGSEVDPNMLRKAIDEVFHEQLKATLKRIAMGLPTYVVNITQSGTVHAELLDDQAQAAN